MKASNCFSLSKAETIIGVRTRSVNVESLIHGKTDMSALSQHTRLHAIKSYLTHLVVTKCYLKEISFRLQDHVDKIVREFPHTVVYYDNFC